MYSVLPFFFCPESPYKIRIFFSTPLSLVYQQIFLIRFLEGHLWSDLRQRVRLLALKISPVMTRDITKIPAIDGDFFGIFIVFVSEVLHPRAN